MGQSAMTEGAALARRGSVAAFAGASFLATALGLVTGPLVARALGPSGRGEVAAAAVYAALITLVVGFNLPAAVGFAAATDPDSRSAVLASMVRFAAWSMLPLAAIALGVVSWPLSELSFGGRLGAALMIATVPVAVLGTCFNSLLVAGGALHQLTRLRILPPLAAAVCTVTLYATGMLTVLSALLIGTATAVGTAGLGWRLVRIRPHGRADLPGLVGFGLRGYAGILAGFATHVIDQAVIFAVLGPAPLGFYAVAVTISSIPHSIWLAVHSGWFARVAEERDPVARGLLTSEALRLTLLATTLVSVAIAAVSPVLVPLAYGRAFERAVMPLFLLLPGTILYGLSMVGESSLTAVGRPGRITIAELSGLGLTIAGLPLVVPRFGITGAAVLSSVSYAVVLVVCVVFLRQTGPLSLRVRKADLAALAGLVRSIGRGAGAAIAPPCPVTDEPAPGPAPEGT